MLSVWKDLKRKELMPVKTLMFLIYGGQATLYPYFTIHLKALGISIEQTSIIFAIQPVIALIVAPFIGIMADKIGNFKFLFCFFLVFSAITSSCLLTVPHVQYTTDYPKLNLNLTCQSSPGHELAMEISNHTCELRSENIAEIYFAMDSCNNFCDEDGSVEVCIHNEEHTLCPNYREILLNGTITGSKIVVENVRYSNNTYDHLTCRNVPESSCNSICRVNINHTSQICQGTRTKIADSEMNTFWIYLGIRLMVTLGAGVVNGLLDAASMAIIMEFDADVGYQRIWATAAMCIFAPLSGYLIDYTSDENYRNFSACFYLYSTLYVVAAFVSIFVDLSIKVPSQDVFKNLKKLMRNSEVGLLLFNIGLLGICWGFLENFLFWFLENELNSKGILMGLTVTVGSGTGLFMSLVSTWITRKIGFVNVIVVAFAAYCVRYVGYSYATDPYICLVYEMMENFTVTLLTIGVTLYCTHLASIEMLTTMMTLWNGLHVISGRAFGSLIGGFLVARFGYRRTFRMFSYGCAVACVTYFLINIFYIRKLQKKKRKTDDLQEKIIRERALSVSSVIVNYSTDAAYVSLINTSSILAKECKRRHSDIPLQTSNSFRDMQPRKRISQSLSFVPSSSSPSSTLPNEVRRHINRRFSVMSYTSQLEPISEEITKPNKTQDFKMLDRGEPEGSENPLPQKESESIVFGIDNDSFVPDEPIVTRF